MQRFKKRSLARIEGLESRQLLAGSVTAKLVEVPISAGAKSADSALNNYKSYDLQVTVTGDNDWASGDLKAVLTTGNFYVPGSGNSNTAQKNLWSIAANLEFDTFVTAPNYTNPVILGSYSPGSGTPKFTSNEVNVTWGDFPNTGAGTFTIARLTMTANSVGSIEGRVGNPQQPDNPQYYSYAVPVGNQITGTLWKDADKNGVIGSGEAALQNWQVYLDQNNNGSLDSGETSVRTNSKGNYIFSGLADGTYRVRVNAQSGYTQSFPASTGVYNVTVAGIQSGTDKNFGYYETPTPPPPVGNSVSGRVWNDADGDAKMDSNEIGISNWQVYLDKDNDGKLDSNELSLRTNSKGEYKFSNVPNGSYWVRQNSQSGWRRTFPVSSGSWKVVLANSNTAGTNKNFGNTRAILIQGTVWRDFNKNGTRQSNDSGLSGWRVYIDKDNDGKFDTGEVSVFTDGAGKYAFTSLGGGTYRVRLVVDTSKWKLTTKSTHLLSMSPGQTTSGKDFGVKKL